MSFTIIFLIVTMLSLAWLWRRFSGHIEHEYNDLVRKHNKVAQDMVELEEQIAILKATAAKPKRKTV